MTNNKENQNPLVSVIIPTYNRANSLERAIKSVINQTYKNLEIIVVDDNSTDNTEEIVKSFSDDRIKYVRHFQNKGSSSARNTGIKNSQGEFIAFLDSDDEYLPEKIEKSIQVFNSAAENIGMVCSNFWRIINKEKKIGLFKKINPNYYFPSPSTWVIARKVFENNLLFDEKICAMDDRVFVFSFIKKFSFYFIDEPLVNRYMEESSQGSDTQKLVMERKEFLRKYLADLKKDKKFLARQFYRLGKDLWSIGQKKEARGYILKAFMIYPIKVEYLFKTIFFSFKKTKTKS